MMSHAAFRAGGRRRPTGLLEAFFLAGVAASALASEDVPFEDLGGDRCFMFSVLVPTRVESGNAVELPLELIINENTDYRKLFNRGGLRQSCAGADLAKLIPAVDFAEKTVLGFWVS